MLRTNTPECMASLMPHSESSWLAISVQSMPAATSRSRYSSIFSGATSKATWFMEPMALVRSPWSGRAAGALTPGTPSGAFGEPEEGEAVAAAAVEEEVLSHAGGQLDRLDQRHAEHVRVEVDRPLHVPAYERQVVDAPQLEPAGTACHETALPRRCLDPAIPEPRWATAPRGPGWRRAQDRPQSWRSLGPYDRSRRTPGGWDVGSSGRRA